MLIYGTRSITSTAAGGSFNCPRCAAPSMYQHRRVRRYFTLYFVPLIPLNRLGEYIECRTCAATFQTDVLTYDPAKARQAVVAEYHLAIRRVMALTAGVDGVVTPEEVDRLRVVYAGLVGEELSAAAILQDIRQVRLEGQSVIDSLAPFAGKLNDSGKEQVLKAACLVAAADGRVGDDERALLKSISTALQMSGKQLKTILESIGSD
jgi:tellurite resistance protein